jgi:DNA-binding NarL/FixJ family response regulator
MRNAVLTERQMDVVELIAEGLTTNAIAERLVLRPKSVCNITGAIYNRLNCSQDPEYNPRVCAALWYYRLQLT